MIPAAGLSAALPPATTVTSRHWPLSRCRLWTMLIAYALLVYNCRTWTCAAPDHWLKPTIPTHNRIPVIHTNHSTAAAAPQDHGAGPCGSKTSCLMGAWHSTDYHAYDGKWRINGFMLRYLSVLMLEAERVPLTSTKADTVQLEAFCLLA